MSKFLSPRDKRLALEEAARAMSPRQRFEMADAVYAALTRPQRVALWCRGPRTLATYRWRARRWRRTWGQ